MCTYWCGVEIEQCTYKDGFYILPNIFNEFFLDVYLQKMINVMLDYSNFINLVYNKNLKFFFTYILNMVFFLGRNGSFLRIVIYLL